MPSLRPHLLRQTPRPAINFRSDGRLLLAADASGRVQLLDATGRAVLRRFEGHTKWVDLWLAVAS